MALQYTRWERRDDADRDALGRAALALCRAIRSDTSRARFYWASADEIVILAEAPETRDFFADPTPQGAAAAFALSDLAHWTDFHLWPLAERKGMRSSLQGARWHITCIATGKSA